MQCLRANRISPTSLRHRRLGCVRLNATLCRQGQATPILDQPSPENILSGAASHPIFDRGFRIGAAPPQPATSTGRLLRLIPLFCLGHFPLRLVCVTTAPRLANLKPFTQQISPVPRLRGTVPLTTTACPGDTGHRMMLLQPQHTHTLCHSE